METLIVGVGALGGVIGARALAAGLPVSLAARTDEAAAALRTSGLRVSGMGGEAAARTERVATLGAFEPRFELIVLATKAQEAIELAPRAARLLATGGTLLGIQNGAVSRLLFEQVGAAVLGGLSNVGATLIAPGLYEQRSAGHLLVGEVQGGESERAARVGAFLRRAIDTRVTPRLPNAIWAKLIINCAITTVGAIAARSMRQFVQAPAGAEVFRRAYQEALVVARASGSPPEKMVVEPAPPAWEGAGYEAWLEQVIAGYGDLKPSMQQDLERGRRTEVDFINGYVAREGERLGSPAPLNAAIAAMVHALERGELQPGPARLEELVRLSRR